MSALRPRSFRPLVMAVLLAFVAAALGHVGLSLAVPQRLRRLLPNRHDRRQLAGRSSARLSHHVLAARVRDLREARQLPRRAGARGLTPAARDRGGDAGDLAGRAHVHVPDPERLRLLAACERRRDCAEHEVHLRAHAEPRHGVPGGPVLHATSSARSRTTTARPRDHRDRRPGRHADDPPDPAAGRVPHTARDAVHLRGADDAAACRAVRADSVGRARITSRRTRSTSTSRQLRNPNYHGPRPQRFDSLEYDFNLNEDRSINQVLAGDLDYGPCRPSHDIDRPVRAGQPGRSARASTVVPLPGELRRLYAAEHGAPAVCEPEHAQGGELRRRPHCLRGRCRPLRGDAVRSVPRTRHARLRGHRRLSRASGPGAGTRPRRLASGRSSAADHGLLPHRAVRSIWRSTTSSARTSRRSASR